MTYDPLSYGQIKLRDRAPNPGETPDDLLFEDAGPGYTSDEAQPSDWAEPETEFNAFQTGDSASDVSQFGADVLGEASPQSAPMPSPSPVPTPRPAVARRRVTPGSAAGATNAAAKAPAAPAQQLPRRIPGTRARRSVRRPGRVMGTLMPTVVIASGGSAAGWFYMMEQNMVMAGIVAVTSLVGAALARVMFR